MINDLIQTAAEAGTLGLKGEAITVNGANVTTRDMQARNGVIHAIDNVMMPS